MIDMQLNRSTNSTWNFVLKDENLCLIYIWYENLLPFSHYIPKRQRRFCIIYKITSLHWDLTNSNFEIQKVFCTKWSGPHAKVWSSFKENWDIVNSKPLNMSIIHSWNVDKKWICVGTDSYKEWRGTGRNETTEWMTIKESQGMFVCSIKIGIH